MGASTRPINVERIRVVSEIIRKVINEYFLDRMIDIYEDFGQIMGEDEATEMELETKLYRQKV